MRGAGVPGRGALEGVRATLSVDRRLRGYEVPQAGVRHVENAPHEALVCSGGAGDVEVEAQDAAELVELMVREAARRRRASRGRGDGD